MRIVSIVIAATVMAGCGGNEESAPPPSPPSQPVRGAVADKELRVMLAEIAAAKACEQIRGTFRGLRAEGRQDLTTGLLWTRECKVTSRGTNVTFSFGARGWQWTEKKQKKAGAKFEVRDYVKFDMDATIKGSLDIGYDTDKHITSIWFSPTAPPAVRFTPLGDIPVDEKGLWSEIVGGFATVAMQSPEQQSKDQADKQGTQSFEQELVRGMTVAIDLCTGYQRLSMGRAPKGELGPPDPGESKQRPVDLHPGGMIAFGPYEAPRGMTIDVTSNGPIRVGLACADDVYPAAEAFIAERPAPVIATLAQEDVDNRARLSIDKQRCKVAVVIRSLAQQKVTFDWQRPAGEIARSAGGPVIHCARKQTVDSGGDGPAGRAAARRR